MAKVTLAPARLIDVWAFETGMRSEEVAEVWASDRFEPMTAVMESWSVSSETWTLRINGEVAAMFGVAPCPEVQPKMSVVWLLTTHVVDRYPVAFYKTSKKVVRDLAARHGMLGNYIDVRHTRAVNWAHRIGFELYEPEPFGKQGEMFHPISFGG